MTVATKPRTSSRRITQPLEEVRAMHKRMDFSAKVKRQVNMMWSMIHKDTDAVSKTAYVNKGSVFIYMMKECITDSPTTQRIRGLVFEVNSSGVTCTPTEAGSLTQLRSRAKAVAGL